MTRLAGVPLVSNATYLFDVGRVHLVRSGATRTFAALGTRLEDELDLVRCDPRLTVALGTAAGSVPGVDGRNR
jgi:hypothetical protein